MKAFDVVEIDRESRAPMRYSPYRVVNERLPRNRANVKDADLVFAFSEKVGRVSYAQPDIPAHWIPDRDASALPEYAGNERSKVVESGYTNPTHI